MELVKTILYYTEILIKPSKGTGLRTYYFTDGTTESVEFRMYPPVLPVRIET